MIVEPIRKQNGIPYTNVELVKIYYDKLVSLREGTGATNRNEKRKMQRDFYRICGGSENANQIMGFMKQIVECPDEVEAQRILEDALIPVES